jgi:hypothetical protein
MVKSFEVQVHGFHKEQKGKESDCLGVDVANLFSSSLSAAQIS